MARACVLYTEAFLRGRVCGNMCISVQQRQACFCGKDYGKASLVGHMVRMVPVPSFACVCGGFLPASLSSRASTLSPAFGRGSLLSLLKPTVPWRPSLFFLLLLLQASLLTSCLSMHLHLWGGVQYGDRRVQKGSKQPWLPCGNVKSQPF